MISTILQVIVVFGVIAIGSRFTGIGLGIWGGIGLFLLVTVFGLRPTSAPVDVLLIMIAVATAASVMDAAGGVDYMVRIAEKIIRANPNRIVFVAPLVTWFFAFLAGTANIAQSLMPVIYEVSHGVGIRPERAMTASGVAAQQALVASPVAACTAALIGLFSQNGNDYGLQTILMITLPATLVAVIVTSAVMLRYGKDLKDDPIYQEKLKTGLIKPVKAQTERKPLPARAGFAAMIFILCVAGVVLTGIFPELRTPADGGKPIGMGSFLQIGMFVASGLILIVCRPKLNNAISSPIMRAGMTAVICVFGVAWMSDTFISAHKAMWMGEISDVLKQLPWLFAFVLFFGSMLLNSQAATVRALMPLGFALGLPAPTMLGLYPAVNGTSFLPTSGVVVSTMAFDQSGTTHIGKYVINHSFLVPCVTATTTCTIVAFFLQSILF